MKLADFGSCRGIYSKQPYTEYISTRWYRAPECLLTDGYYGYKMDLWGVGCVFFEIVSLFPLFPGNNELDQIHKIHNILGTPSRDILDNFQQKASHMDFNFPPKEGTGIKNLIPNVNAECLDLIIKLLNYSPENRLSARKALKHPYFRDLREQEESLKHPPKVIVDEDYLNSRGPNKILKGTIQIEKSKQKSSFENLDGDEKQPGKEGLPPIRGAQLQSKNTYNAAKKSTFGVYDIIR